MTTPHQSLRDSCLAAARSRLRSDSRTGLSFITITPLRYPQGEAFQKLQRKKKIRPNRASLLFFIVIFFSSVFVFYAFGKTKRSAFGIISKIALSLYSTLPSYCTATFSFPRISILLPRIYVTYFFSFSI